MLETTTERDAYQLLKTSEQKPAMGHRFDPELLCESCGKSWHDQRTDPTVCPALIDRLQMLEDFERFIKPFVSKLNRTAEDLSKHLSAHNAAVKNKKCQVK